MITISPGHYRVGTGTKNLLEEVTEARKVVNRVTEILIENNVDAIIIEDNVSNSQTENLHYLVDRHNATQRKVDVSVHFNASAGTVKQGIGTEVLYYDAVALATEMTREIASVSGLKNRGAKKRQELAFLKGTSEPAILIEVCFINSMKDVALYKEHFERICMTIARVLAKYVGKSLDGHTVPLTFSTKALEEKVNELLRDSHWRKTVLENGVQTGAFQKVWLDRNVSDLDFMGLCVLVAKK